MYTYLRFEARGQQNGSAVRGQQNDSAVWFFADDLSSVCRTHAVGGGNQLSQGFLIFTGVHPLGAHAHVHTRRGLLIN